MNLLLIVSDTFRWDYIGAYGNRWIRTPHLDAMAAESALFLDAYAEGLPTLPARRVIMTGRNIVPFEYRPQKSDMVQTHGWHPLYDEDVTLAEHLSANGYFTAFFNDVYHMMKPGKNFHRGFDQWFWIRGQEADAYGFMDRARVEDLIDRFTHGHGSEFPDRSWLIRHFSLRKNWKGDADTLVGKTMALAAEWLREYTLDKPFYLHVECFDPHEPWDPPAEYAREYEPVYGDSLDGCGPPMTTQGLAPQMLANIKAAYAGEVTLVDRWIGHLTAALKESGRLDDTLIVFTSDHGCMMGEQGEIHKGASRLRNQVTRLPLLIRHPKGEAAGMKVSGFVQHQDILPTALHLMGQPIPERALGRDIWGQTRGERSAPDAVVSAFGQFASIRTRQWNLIMPWTKFQPSEEDTATAVQLYDLEADPEELTNVITQRRSVAKEHSQRLREHIARFAPLTSGSFQTKKEEGGFASFAALPRLDEYLY